VFCVIAFAKVVTLDVKVVTLDVKVATVDVKVVTIDVKVVTIDVKVATVDVKVVTVVVKVVTATALKKSRFVSYNSRLDSFVQTTRLDKTEVAKGIPSHRTKASTFAIEKIAKELAFSPSHTPTYV
jgi:hypothetical protein